MGDPSGIVCTEGKMTVIPLPTEEIARRGNAIYQESIRERVLPQFKGKFLVLDIDSGDYEIDDDDLIAEETLARRHPQGVFFGLRIGYTSAYTLAGRIMENSGE